MIQVSPRFRGRVPFHVLPFLLAAASWNIRVPSILALHTQHLGGFQTTVFSSIVGHHHTRVNHRPNSRHRIFHTTCNLFFRKADGSNITPRRRNSIDPDVFHDLQSAELSLPYDIFLEQEDEDDSSCQGKLSVRFMTPDDIQQLMPICIDEFGTGSTMSLLDFPWYNFRRVSNWWDRVIFEPSVTLSLLCKMNANLRHQSSTTKDPAMLVLCQYYPSKKDEKEKVVGMVEVSLQAPQPNRNPPPFPIPLWIKDLYCRLTSNRLQGWVTNLLIDPQYRGLGYAKILMAATEGVTKSWGGNFIYLHADADYQSGKVAQTLYKGLGYEVVTDDSSEYDWMTGGNQNPFSSIRIIEGVPLLCFRKRL